MDSCWELHEVKIMTEAIGSSFHSIYNMSEIMGKKTAIAKDQY